MQNRCSYDDCGERPNLLTTFGKCLMCGETYCPRHLTNPEYARFLHTALPTVYPGHAGFCVDCILRHQPTHVKGAIDRKCSRIDCLASLASVTTVKRMCSYCGRWFCTGHFFTREQLTTELLSGLKRFRIVDGEGACEDCMKRDPVGAMIVGKKGFLGSRAAEMGEKLADVIEQRLPQIAQQTGSSLVKGTVSGIQDEKRAIVHVAQEALDSPVRQRIWGTVIALVGTALAAVFSMYLAGKNVGNFFSDYRWVSAAIFGGLTVLSLAMTVVKMRRLWKAVSKAGAFGTAAREVAMGTFRRAMWVHLPLLVVVLAITGFGLYWFAFRSV